MDSPSLKRTHKFDDHYCTFLNIVINSNKSPNSPFKLGLLKLSCFCAIILFTQIFLLLTRIIIFILAPDFDISEITEGTAFLSTFAISFSRIIAFIVNHKDTNAMLQRLEILFPITPRAQMQYNLSKYLEPIVKRTKIYRTLGVVTTFGFIIRPLVQSCFNFIVSGQKYQYDYPLISWYPFDSNQLIAYPFVYTFQTLAICSSTQFFFIEDLIFAPSVVQMCMYYRYMGSLIRKMDAKIESKNGEQNMKNIIRYQYFLQRIQGDFNDIFSLSTFISFTMIHMSICFFAFMMFQPTDGENKLVLCFGSVTVLILAAFIKCSYATDLEEANADLIHSIYDHNWYEGTPKYRKMVVVMMIRFNLPLKFKASKMKYINMECFQEIMTQTYRMFTFIYNFSE